MGQYHVVVNLDKKEYLHAHRMNCGLKLWEWNGAEVTHALTILLSNSNGRGGGDFPEHPLQGTWAGDRIVVAGDYAHSGDPAEAPVDACDENYKNIYIRAHEGYTDISDKLLEWATDIQKVYTGDKK